MISFGMLLTVPALLAAGGKTHDREKQQPK
jgi:hypothetical protein